MIRKFIISILLIVIFVGATWSLYQPGLFKLHDSTHAARISEMKTSLVEGHFPPRWSANFGYGFGMPLFEFYAPLPYFVGAIFFWLGINIEWSIKLLFIISTLVTMIGGLKLGQKLYGSIAGVVVAASLTLAPYRAVNLFVRGALSEAWGLMALPWILYGLLLIAEDRNKKFLSSGWVTLVLSLVVMMLSHNLTTLMFVPFSLLFIGGYLVIKKGINKQVFTKVIEILGYYLLAIGLSSFYMIPALAEKNFVKIGKIVSGYFHYSHHFLYIRQFFYANWGYGGSGWGPDDGFSFYLGLGQLIGFGLAALIGLLILLNHLRLKKIKALLTNKKLMWVSWLVVLMCLALYLSLLKAKFIWDTLPLISFIQFPFRWITVALIFLGLIDGWAISMLSNKTARYALGLGLFLVILLNSAFYKPYYYLTSENEVYFTQPDQIQGLVSNILPDYIPIQMSEDIASGYRNDQGIWVAHGTNNPEDVILNKDNNLQYQILVDRGHQKLVSVNLSQDTIIDFKIANFPGWIVEVDGQKVDHQTAPLGNIQVAVPAGNHLVGVYFGKTPVRLTADIISALSLLILIFLLKPINSKSAKKI